MALTTAEITAIADAVWNKVLVNPVNSANVSAGTFQRWADKREQDTRDNINDHTDAVLASIVASLSNITNMLNELTKDPADEPPASILVRSVRWANDNPTNP
jgi:hypothetical protein